jgi:hypothetical protein
MQKLPDNLTAIPHDIVSKKKQRARTYGMYERNETRVATKEKAARSIKRSRGLSWNILRGLISKLRLFE